jgi:hypothetical protein
MFDAIICNNCGAQQKERTIYGDMCWNCNKILIYNYGVV